MGQVGHACAGPVRSSHGYSGPIGNGRSPGASRTSAVNPSSVTVSCSSPSSQKTASPAPIGANSPSAPETRPELEHGQQLRDDGRVAGDPAARAEPKDGRLHGSVAGERLGQRRDRHALEPRILRRPRRLRAEPQPFHSSEFPLADVRGR